MVIASVKNTKQSPFKYQSMQRELPAAGRVHIDERTEMMSDKLKFNPEAYTDETLTLDGRTISFRAYKSISYCENPVDRIQTMNLYVPSAFYEQEEYRGYTLKTVPIFMPNTVGGYMEGDADEPGRNFLGMVNSVFEALDHGYVVACAGIRGRNTGMISKEFFVGGNAKGQGEKSGKTVGRAPALAVDMKAAIRYLRHNKETIPGDTERIITSGTSAGGALSAITGASGNSADYEPYLQAIGAAEERDDIFAANCYCPIHNLEHADAAYEWLFHKEHTAYMMRFEEKDGKVEMRPMTVELTEKQKAVSEDLRKLFPVYVNGLHLQDEQGVELTLDEEGEGSFADLVFSYVAKSAEKELADHESLKKHPAHTVPGSKVEEQSYLTIENGKVIGLDRDAYIAKITRMKSAPSFDHLDLHSPENEEFGDEEVFARHFTQYSQEHSEVPAEMAEEQLIKMLNPTRYIGEADTAKHWRIRHGAFDRDTSLAIPVILATMLKNNGNSVDFALPWGAPHSGDYDLPELFAWVDALCKGISSANE